MPNQKIIKRIVLLCHLMAVAFVGAAQLKVDFELRQLPPQRDAVETYFLAGDFNNWQPNDPAYRFTKNKQGNWCLTLTLRPDAYAYKLTRGSWTTVESKANGAAVANRALRLDRDTLIKMDVLHWADEFEPLLPQHSASANVKLLDTTFFMPQLQKTRRIWIYLPPSYQSANKSYPVLYMQDGQNLFDAFTSGYGEWGIDETLDSLAAKGMAESIVVGIDHGGVARMTEYNPYQSSYGAGQGKAYVEFLVHTLKPYVDQHYRTLTDRQHTAIAGSSMGGLIAMYAMASYPNVFGAAGIFSPAFWIGQGIEADLRAAKPALAKANIYFVAGQLEGDAMLRDMDRVYRILDPKAKQQRVIKLESKDGQHQEWFWRREFVSFYKFITPEPHGTGFLPSSLSHEKLMLELLINFFTDNIVK